MIKRTIKKALYLGKRIFDPAHRKASNATHILIACFPKSGSTYLSRLLVEITGFPHVGLVQYYEHNEPDIYKPALENAAQKNTITQQHVKGTVNNIALLKKFNIKPVILTRNIYDVVISIYDHIENTDHRIPLGYVHKQYFEMTRESKIDFIIKIILPWYFNFFVSWIEASQEIETLWLSYDELFSNQRDTVEKILNFYSLPINPEKIEEAMPAVKGKKTRFNVGISGRGASLSNAQKEMVVRTAEVWRVDPSIMKTIGIDL
jgi:hypothetical protein